ncbi:MAG: VirB3 family type IV secretion system protein [Alphaproteobacteria bacterium]|nr:VirB3 family type IV secretion system protein [Alphaproteobacteria bacterium]
MRQHVLKALANPARIFYVPYSVAVLNFFIQFSVWIVAFMTELAIVNEVVITNPLYFLLSVITAHFVLIGFCKREPQLANIINAKIQLFRQDMPDSLVV